jgi:mannonate dehydratase
MAELGYIEKNAMPLFRGLREHNALLFDFVLKRSLRVGGKRLSAGIFETRGFFDRDAARGEGPAPVAAGPYSPG